MMGLAVATLALVVAIVAVWMMVPKPTIEGTSLRQREPNAVAASQPVSSLDAVSAAPIDLPTAAEAALLESTTTASERPEAVGTAPNAEAPPPPEGTRFAVRGVVRDSTGEPIEAARVRLSRATWIAPTGYPGAGNPTLTRELPLVSTFTDAEGRYLLYTNHALSWFLIASSEGYAAFAVTVDEAKPFRFDAALGIAVLEQDFQLSDALAIEGRVVNEEGDGLEGVQISAAVNSWRREEGLAGGEGATRVLSDREGNFRLGGLTSSVYAIRADAAGFAGFHQPSVKAGQRLEIVLRRGGAVIAGKVLDWEDQPVAGAEVELRPLLPPNQASVDPTAWQTISGVDGTFRLEALPAGNFALMARKESARLLTPDNQLALTISLGTNQQLGDVELRLFGGYLINGRVQDEATGDPIAGAEVYEGNHWQQRSPATQSDSEGRFVLRGVHGATDAGRGVRVEVFASAPGWVLPAPRSGKSVASAHVQPTQQEVTIDVPMRRMVEWQGRVLTPEGAALPGAVVTVLDAARLNTVADRRGHFKVPVPVRGPAQLQASATGYPTTWSPVVEVGVEAPPAVDILMDPGAMILIEVVDEENRPIEGARAGVMTRTYSKANWSSSEYVSMKDTDKSGQAEVGPVSSKDATLAHFLESRSVDVFVQKDGYDVADEVRDLKLEPRERRKVRFVLRPEGIGEIAGVVRTEAGDPIEAVEVNLSIGDRHEHRRTDAKGVFHFKALTEGDVRLTFHHPDYGHIDRNDITVGTLDAEVVLTVQFVDVALFVTDKRSGEPLPSARAVHNPDGKFDAWVTPKEGIADPRLPGTIRMPRIHRMLGGAITVTAPGYQPVTIDFETLPAESAPVIPVELVGE
jgi:protocatechuate 3,4-dioxygenase beta subunit